MAILSPCEPVPQHEGPAVELAGDQPLAGICYLVAGLALFSIQDVIIKSLSGTYSVNEIVFFRSLGAFLPVLILVRMEGGMVRLRPRHPFWVLLRALMHFGAYSTYYMALAVLPLAETTTLFYSSPLFITALSVVILRETVGRYRWLAVVAGFLGVLAVARPGTLSFEPAMLLATLAAVFYAFSVLITRRLGKAEHSSTMSLYSTLVFLVVSSFAGILWGQGSGNPPGHESLQFFFRAWSMPPRDDLALLLGMGLIAGIGFFCLTQAYRVAPTATVAPFEYSSLPWAILWGYLVWGDIPGPWTLLGIILVVGSGLTIMVRENQKRRRRVLLRPRA